MNSTAQCRRKITPQSLQDLWVWARIAILLGVLRPLEAEGLQAKHTPLEEGRRRVEMRKERMGWFLEGLKTCTRWLETEYWAGATWWNGIKGKLNPLRLRAAMSHNLIDWSHRDAHWFNTVHIPRTDIEQILGYKHLETRARNYYALGISLSALFDIPASGDFLRALIKLLEEWESFCEGSTGAKGVVSVRLYLYQH